MIRLHQLVFAYSQTAFQLEVGEFTVAAGETLLITGPSGSGKTTLLHLIAGILLPSSGTIEIDAWTISQQTDSARRGYRVKNIGMVFQEFELLEYLTVGQNVLLPYRINRGNRLDPGARERSEQLAQSLGIGGTLRRYPSQLSHGERQRVAICRALLMQPKIILADEPTGNLDPANRRVIMDLLLRETVRHSSTLLMVSHDHSLAGRFNRTIDMEQFSSTKTDHPRPLPDGLSVAP